MPKTISTTVYTYDELSDKAKEKARDWYRQVAFDYDWYESVYEDAAQAGLEITGFDIGRSNDITGKFKDDALNCAWFITKNHGKECATFKTASAFLKERDECVEAAPRDENGDFEDQRALDEQLDEIEREFLRAILEDYLSNLRAEYDYLNSDEQVDEAITANEYTFTEDGKLF